jgi:hypothetical protein
MATRGCIGRKTENGTLEMRYHHFDSYPSGLGKSLYEIYNGHFQQDLPKMMSFLVDEHPAGWSTIKDCDFSLAPGYMFHDYRTTSWEEYWDSEDYRRPHCYCHGARHDKAAMYTSIAQANESSCEFIYVFSVENEQDTMTVYEGNTVIGTVLLRGEEPDWDSMGMEEE